MVVWESKKPSSHRLEVEGEGACEKQGGEGRLPKSRKGAKSDVPLSKRGPDSVA